MKLSLELYKKIDYPSASAIEFYNNSFYLIGDDSNKMLCLNKQLNTISEIELFKYNGDRIPKKEKPDFEACTIINHQLFIFGSGSLLPQRGYLFVYNFNDKSLQKLDISDYYKHIISKNKIQELNIEGIANIKDVFLFFNRANNKQENKLIISYNFLRYAQLHSAKNNEMDSAFIDIEIPTLDEHRLGISGAAYIEKEDRLYLTASAENTDNAYDDGEIIGSVLCIVENASSKIQNNKIVIADYIKLENVDNQFKHQKIESICLYNDDGVGKMLLVADNDNGQSELFLLTIDV